MCGCMLKHAMMDHADHQPVAQSEPDKEAMVAPGQKRCTHCNFPLQNDFAFCPSCGMSLRPAVCPACGQKIQPGWGACAYCGSPLGDLK